MGKLISFGLWFGLLYKPSIPGYKCTLLVDKSTLYNCTVKSINLYQPLELPLTLSSTTCPCVNLVSTATKMASCVHPTWTLKPVFKWSLWWTRVVRGVRKRAKRKGRRLEERRHSGQLINFSVSEPKWHVWRNINGRCWKLHHPLHPLLL